MTVLTLVLSIVLAISLVLNTILGASTIFLGRELIKKFALWADFYHHVQEILYTTEYLHPGGIPTMGNLRFRTSEAGKFGVLLSFNIAPHFPKLLLRMLGLSHLIDKKLLDPFGFCESANSTETSPECQMASIDTWLGKGPAEFVAITTIPHQVAFNVGQGTPGATRYKPHILQRLGLFDCRPNPTKN